MNKTLFTEPFHTADNVRRLEEGGFEIVSVSNVHPTSACIVYRNPRPSEDLAKLQARVDSLLSENDDLLNTVDEQRNAIAERDAYIQKIKAKAEADKQTRDIEDMFF